MYKTFASLGFKPGDRVKCVGSNFHAYVIGEEYYLRDCSYFPGEQLVLDFPDSSSWNGYDGEWELVKEEQWEVFGSQHENQEENLNLELTYKEWEVLTSLVGMTAGIPFYDLYKKLCNLHPDGDKEVLNVDYEMCDVNYIRLEFIE